MRHAAVPYCGTPPVPAELWQSWNLDPWLLAGLGAALACWALALQRTPPGRRREAGALALGILVVAAATVSPLCRLGVALFSARMAQHLLLVVVAAPLIARGLAALHRGHVRARPRDVAAAAAFAACLWIWHLPGPYDATLRSDLLYWTGHLSLLATATWLWRGLLAGDAGSWLPRCLLAAGTFVQMGLLGALLTFAPEPLFAAHRTTTGPWGLGPLEDQQLGGLLCWVPGGLAFFGTALAATATALTPPRLAAARS